MLIVSCPGAALAAMMASRRLPMPMPSAVVVGVIVDGTVRSSRDSNLGRSRRRTARVGPPRDTDFPRNQWGSQFANMMRLRKRKGEKAPPAGGVATGRGITCRERDHGGELLPLNVTSMRTAREVGS